MTTVISGSSSLLRSQTGETHGECPPHLWELGGSDGGALQDGEEPGLNPLNTGKHGVGSCGVAERVVRAFRVLPSFPAFLPWPCLEIYRCYLGVPGEPAVFRSRRGGGSECPDLASSHGAIYAYPGINTIDKPMSVVMWLSGPGEGWRPRLRLCPSPPLSEGSWLNPFFSPNEYSCGLPRVS